ncbi:hypothetical protein FHG87_005918 [Trinorchestia longiramus]|nr:hypothetical protein FHG87_005918 [Trinorchestia longiramus]
MASKTKQKVPFDVSSFINTGLLVCLLICATIVTLVLLRTFFATYKPGCKVVETSTERTEFSSLPYIPHHLDDFLSVLTPLHGASCQHLVNVTPRILEHRPFKIGMEAPTLCMDTMPHNMSPNNCKIYSIDPHNENIFFELKMGHLGCRVHVITKSTSLNYGVISNNSYLYPLHISADPGNSHYSLDSYINLMSHEMKDIHVVKTGVNGSEWRFLNTLYTSRTEAWKFIKQLRMVIHVPALTSTTREEFSFKYLLLKGLRSLQFHLVYSKPLVVDNEKMYAEIIDRDPDALPSATSFKIRPMHFETVWLKE